jgi:hypothetical protein
MAKEKKDLIILGETYKNIDVSTYGGSYTLDTTGIAQVIKQYVKNNYGDIKVWAKSRSFAGGSSVDIYLWNVPTEWFKKIDDFAESFGKYNEYDGGDGIWKGRDVSAKLTDGTIISNWSPYVHVNNKPPYGSKEYDMPPPNYEDMPKPKKKEYKGKFEKKGAKFSPTDNLDLILDCGNGWKIYVGKPKEKYLYKAVKDEGTEPNREKWAEIKSDMLEVGFQWNWKDATFIRWATNADDTIQQMACNVLSKYWAGESQPKEETPKSETTFKVGDKVRLIKDLDKRYFPNNQELELGDIGIVKNDEGGLGIYYDIEFNGKEIYLGSSYLELVEKAPTKEVNLDQYIDDLNLLLELTPNESKKLELATYINDLNTLKLLQ